MTTRLVCRSAPRPTKHIAEQLEEDQWAAVRDDPQVRERVSFWTGMHRAFSVTLRDVLGAPADTDNAQCWSEEIFSMLEGER